jgi:hypothetical protein
MILSAVLDPSLFETEAIRAHGTNTQRQLDEMLRAYVWVGDRQLCFDILKVLDSVTQNESLENALRLRAQKVRSRFADLIAKRMVSVKPNSRMNVPLPSLPACTAKVFSILEQTDAIDVMFATKQNKDLLDECCPSSSSRVHDHDSFIDSKPYKREMESRSAISLNGKPVQRFRELMLPFCYWQPQIHIIDRFIGNAALNDQRNWRSFFNTLQLLYEIWDAGKVHIQKKQFRIRTFVGKPDMVNGKPARETPDERKKRARQKGEILRAKLSGIGDKLQVDICDLKSNPRAEHDRYLVGLDGDLVVGFSSGFDEINNGSLGPCDIYLRGSSTNDAHSVVKLMLEAPVQWRSEDSPASQTMSNAFANIGL